MTPEQSVMSFAKWVSAETTASVAMQSLFDALQNQLVQELASLELHKTQKPAGDFVPARMLYDHCAASESGDSFDSWLKRIKKDRRIQTQPAGDRRLSVHAGDYIRVVGSAAKVDFDAIEKAVEVREQGERERKAKLPRRR